MVGYEQAQRSRRLAAAENKSKTSMTFGQKV
jgi:hypothetical protein